VSISLAVKFDIIIPIR